MRRLAAVALMLALLVPLAALPLADGQGVSLPARLLAAAVAALAATALEQATPAA